jgi:hypothetical protein
MKQGFFLDRVGIGRNDLVVVERIQNAVDIPANSASARFTLGNQASVRTQKALYLFILGRFPQNCLFRHTLSLLRPADALEIGLRFFESHS